MVACKMAHQNQHTTANQTLDNQLMASTFIKPVTIPAEILSLENANLSEKLTLALFAANPEITESRVRRLVGIKQDGLRILKDRLVQKRFLTQRGGRHLICVPGLVYRDDPEGGHFVPEFKGQENGQKVAPPEPTITHPNGGIAIPAEILDLKGVGASEKFLLTVYATNSNATNAVALRVLGISPAGLKKLKGRLIRGGLLTREGAGYRIQVPGMVFIADAEGGYFIPETEAIKSGKIVAPRVVKTAIDITQEWQAAVQHFEAVGQTRMSTFLVMTTEAIKEIETETLADDPFREQALGCLRSFETIYFDHAFLFDQIPKSFWQQGIKLLANATMEQLEAFRQKAEGLMLAGLSQPKQLAMATEALTQIAQQPGTRTKAVPEVGRENGGGGRN